jgi:protocatechuate 3,4-dioxygenase beta subunit
MFSRYDVLSRSFLWPRAVTLSLAMISVAALEQTTYGSLSGTVTDTTGAAVSGATVTLTNTGTGERQSQATGGAGLYTFVNLQPGNYALNVTHDGSRR